MTTPRGHGRKMPPEEHARRTREGVARARERQRLLVADIDRYAKSHEISEGLRPLVSAKRLEAEQMRIDLGGDPTAQQAALIDQAMMASVVRAAAFLAWCRDGAMGGRALDRFVAACNAERNALTALGLGRVARDALDVAYDAALAEAQARDSQANAGERESQAEEEGDLALSGDLGSEGSRG